MHFFWVSAVAARTHFCSQLFYCTCLAASPVARTAPLKTAHGCTSSIPDHRLPVQAPVAAPKKNTRFFLGFANQPAIAILTAGCFSPLAILRPPQASSRVGLRGICRIRRCVLAWLPFLTRAPSDFLRWWSRLSSAPKKLWSRQLLGPAGLCSYSGNSSAYSKQQRLQSYYARGLLDEDKSARLSIVATISACTIITTPKPSPSLSPVDCLF